MIITQKLLLTLITLNIMIGIGMTASNIYNAGTQDNIITTTRTISAEGTRSLNQTGVQVQEFMEKNESHNDKQPSGAQSTAVTYGSQYKAGSLIWSLFTNSFVLPDFTSFDVLDTNQNAVAIKELATKTIIILRYLLWILLAIELFMLIFSKKSS